MKKVCFAVLLAATLLFCSCSVQTKFDITDFCDRFNSLSGEKILSPDVFFAEEDGELLTLIEVGQSCLTVSIIRDADGAVTGMGLSIPSDNSDKNDFPELLSAARNALGAFLYSDTEKANEIFSYFDLTAENITFSEKILEYGDEKYFCTLISDPLALTVKIDKQPR